MERLVNFKISEDFLEAIKEIARGSGVSVSELIRRALLALPVSDGGRLLDVVSSKEVLKKGVEGVQTDEIQAALARQEMAFRMTTKALRAAVGNLDGKGIVEIEDVAQRLDKMAEWAKNVEVRLKKLEERT